MTNKQKIILSEKLTEAISNENLALRSAGFCLGMNFQHISIIRKEKELSLIGNRPWAILDHWDKTGMTIQGYTTLYTNGNGENTAIAKKTTAQYFIDKTRERAAVKESSDSGLSINDKLSIRLAEAVEKEKLSFADASRYLGFTRTEYAGRIIDKKDRANCGPRMWEIIDHWISTGMNLKSYADYYVDANGNNKGVLTAKAKRINEIWNDPEPDSHIPIELRHKLKQLIDLYELTKEPMRTKWRELASVSGITENEFKYLRMMNYITYTGGTRSTCYVWNTDPPTIDMARSVLVVKLPDRPSKTSPLLEKPVIDRDYTKGAIDPTDQPKTFTFEETPKPNNTEDRKVINWIHQFKKGEISVRLINILFVNFRDRNVEDIVDIEFLKEKGAGIKSWNEFQLLLGRELEPEQVVSHGEFKIESSIPIPGPEDKYPFDKMEIGDSFSAGDHSNKLAGNIRTAIWQYIKKTNSKKEFTTKKHNNQVRCWRIK